MKILITAGNTQAPIDRVRCITNVFTGRTGAAIAVEAHRRGHAVTLLTSHPETIDSVNGIECVSYRTFDELSSALAGRVQRGGLDAIVHCAAVSDYYCEGVYAPSRGTWFDPTNLTWHGDPPRLVDRAAEKVKSDAPELWLQLTKTPKLVDRVRRDWGFRGILVKFKLEVGVSLDELLAVAENSRLQSDADWMVANTLESVTEQAYLGSAQGYEPMHRGDLPLRLLDVIEAQHEEAQRG
jgi:phosphopantothenate-cysteine ligase/phosphopantothenoylcysteine decarboxylase/phosphopantothenate--cysteine ligase